VKALKQVFNTLCIKKKASNWQEKQYNCKQLVMFSNSLGHGVNQYINRRNLEKQRPNKIDSNYNSGNQHGMDGSFPLESSPPL
jgi:hypothetical protein